MDINIERVQKQIGKNINMHNIIKTIINYIFFSILRKHVNSIFLEWRKSKMNI